MAENVLYYSQKTKGDIKMSEFTSMGKINGYLKTIKIEDDKGLHDLVRKLGDGRKVKIIIQYEDPRQDWIDKWYKRAVAAADDTVIFKFVKDGTVCIPILEPEYTEVAAPREGDKYDRKTGIAVAFAKTRDEEIPDYI